MQAMERSVIGFERSGPGAGHGLYLRLFPPDFPPDDQPGLEAISPVGTDYIERLYDITTAAGHCP